MYVVWVALFSTLAGLIYGAWVDGTSLGLIALYLAAFLAVLAGVLWWVSRRNQRRELFSMRRRIEAQSCLGVGAA